MIGLKLNTLPRNVRALPMRSPFSQVSVVRANREHSRVVALLP